MKTIVLTVAIAGAIACSGCTQNGGSGSSGTANRSAGADQSGRKAGEVPNVERGNPPGSPTGGTGPVTGTPGAGSNTGAVRNGESAGTSGRQAGK